MRTAGTVHDLDTVAGRLTALCAVIQCCEYIVSLNQLGLRGCGVSWGCKLLPMLQLVPVPCSANLFSSNLCCCCCCYAVAAAVAAIAADRLMVAMWRSLPDLPGRKPLWSEIERGGASITLTPAGAVKKIERFKPFAQPHGMTQASLKDAYKAAAAAAQQQHNQGLKPFLVSAAKGPKFTGDRFEVSTTPLGYNRHITTEAVRTFVGLIWGW